MDRMKHDGAWHTGRGDVALAFRRTVFASRRSGTVAAAGGEVAFPFLTSVTNS